MARAKTIEEEIIVEEPVQKMDKFSIILENKNKHLEEKVQELEKQLLEQEKIIEDNKKSKEEIIANEHNVRKDLDKAKAELIALNKSIEIKDKQLESLKNDLTKLANLFDEYINAYQDQTKMLAVFVKNTQTVEKYLSNKIEEFNGGSKK
jgi:chromosome segregation ATPase